MKADSFGLLKRDEKGSRINLKKIRAKTFPEKIKRVSGFLGENKKGRKKKKTKLFWEKITGGEGGTNIKKTQYKINFTHNDNTEKRGLGLVLREKRAKGSAGAFSKSRKIYRKGNKRFRWRLFTKKSP